MEQNETMNPIEQKEIRGLSIKGLITLILCTVSICGTVLGTYNSVINRIDQMRTEKIGDDKVIDLRIRSLEETVKANRTAIDELRRQVSENRRAIQQGQ